VGVAAALVGLDKTGKGDFHQDVVLGKDFFEPAPDLQLVAAGQGLAAQGVVARHLFAVADTTWDSQRS
jgi:hypothetical protein